MEPTNTSSQWWRWSIILDRLTNPAKTSGNKHNSNRSKRASPLSNLNCPAIKRAAKHSPPKLLDECPEGKLLRSSGTLADLIILATSSGELSLSSGIPKYLKKSGLSLPIEFYTQMKIIIWHIRAIPPNFTFNILVNKKDRNTERSKPKTATSKRFCLNRFLAMKDEITSNGRPVEKSWWRIWLIDMEQSIL